MADFSHSKVYKGTSYPLHCYESSNLFKRVEPMLTPSKLISRFLLGVNLPEAFKDVEVLKDRINMAQNEAEVLLKTTMTPELFVVKSPYDSTLYRSHITLRVEHKPILSVESIRVVSADGENIYEIPSQWIEVANATSGCLNVIPLLSSFGAASGGGTIVSQNAGMIFIATLGSLMWLPAFWEIKYRSGLTLNEGQVPVLINNIVGCMAAIDLLSNLGSLNLSNSVSISQDGISQSTSGQGPAIYSQRIQELEAKKTQFIKEIKAMYGNSIVYGNI
jgi:hypothetical protein